MEKQYGLRYTIEKKLETIHKEKWFKTEIQRDAFMLKMNLNEESFEVESFSNPVMYTGQHI